MGAQSMDAFNYLSVLLSIILGLAITQILKGVRGMVLSRARVVPYWPTFVFAGLLFLIDVQSWWAFFEMRHITLWTFPVFALVLTQVTAMYLLAALVLPDFFGSDVVDLRKHYYDHNRIFYGIFVAGLLASLLKFVPLDGRLPSDHVDVGFQCGWIVMCVIGALTRREWYHKMACALSALAFLVYVCLLFMRLR